MQLRLKKIVGLEDYINEESRDEENGGLENKSVEIAPANTISQMPLSGKQVSHVSPASPLTKSLAISGDVFCTNNDNVSPASPSTLDHDFKEVKDSIPTDPTDPPKTNSSSIPNDAGDLQVQIEHSKSRAEVSSDLEGIDPEYIYGNEDDNECQE
jgi:hypothetical protein